MKIEGLIMPSVTNFYLIIPKSISYFHPNAGLLKQGELKIWTAVARLW